MDRPTREIYEEHAGEWAERRSPRHIDTAKAFAAGSIGPSVDLGCGPGWYSPSLPAPVVVLDAAASMLALAGTNAPGAWCVQGDLERLPFRRGSFATVWARNTYVHLPRASIPLVLADLHRTMRLDARFLLTLFGGEVEGRGVFEDDDFPGRFFSTWQLDAVCDLVVGAGFTIERIEETGRAHGERQIEVEARRARTLPDYVAPGLKLLLCGLNPSLRSADAGVGFVTPSNRFWPAAIAAGIVSRARDPWHAVEHHHVGFTDLVKRASVGAAELAPEEYREGFARVERLAAWLKPEVVCFVGLSGWRAAVDRKAVAGWQERGVGGQPAYVMPNPSGLNAHTKPADLAAHLRNAASGAPASSRTSANREQSERRP